MFKNIFGVLVGIMLLTALVACEMPAKKPVVTEPAEPVVTEPAVPVVDQELDKDLAELDQILAEIDQIEPELDITEYEEEIDVTID